jgi:hypothetical protein
MRIISKLIIGAILLQILLFLFGCTQQGGHQENITNQTIQNVTENKTGDFEFTVPSELPIAYVGTPYFYSFCNPEPTGTPSEFVGYACGKEGNSVNPKGGTPPYYISTKVTGGYNAYNVHTSGGAFLNFTPALGDEGEYNVEVCAKDSGYNENHHEICRNATLYIMSDTVTVKGDGELNYSLMFALESNIRAADFTGKEAVKDISTGYVPTTSYIYNKVTAEVPAATRPCAPGAHCGGGAYASEEIKTDSHGVELIAEGNAPCGAELTDFPGEYQVDYYHVGYIGYKDNAHIALAATNTGTKEKAVDILLETSSELSSESKNYFDSSVNAQLCIGYDEKCVFSSSRKAGSQVVNSTTVRAIIRPGRHFIEIGTMNNRFANTNTVKCPSVVKARSKVTVIINGADMSDGKKSVGSLYSYMGRNGVESVWSPK